MKQPKLHMLSKLQPGVHCKLHVTGFTITFPSEILGSPPGQPAPKIRVPEQISGSLWLPGTR